MKSKRGWVIACRRLSSSTLFTLTCNINHRDLLLRSSIGHRDLLLRSGIGHKVPVQACNKPCPRLSEPKKRTLMLFASE